jgi:hypothetical protein
LGFGGVTRHEKVKFYQHGEEKRANYHFLEELLLLNVKNMDKNLHVYCTPSRYLRAVARSPILAVIDSIGSKINCNLKKKDMFVYCVA